MDLAVSDPVVGLTLFVPIADRRPEADRNPIAAQRPAGGMQRGIDGDTATARTQVFHRPVLAADVEPSGIQLARNLVDEFGA